MPVEISSTTLQLTTDMIRMFLRDTPDFNILLDDVEFREEDIQLAMRLTVSKWNIITPITNYTDPAQLNEALLLYGVCGFLLKSEGLRQLRNEMQTQDGNIDRTSLDEKEQQYMRWAMHFQNLFERLAKDAKIQFNMESLLDGCGFGSGYRYVGRYPI